MLIEEYKKERIPTSLFSLSTFSTLAFFYNRRILLIICTYSTLFGGNMTSIQLPVGIQSPQLPRIPKLSLQSIAFLVLRILYLPAYLFFRESARICFYASIQWWFQNSQLSQNPGRMLKACFPYQHAKRWAQYGVYLEHLATPWEEIETIPWEEVYTPDPELMAWEKMNNPDYR